MKILVLFLLFLLNINCRNSLQKDEKDIINLEDCIQKQNGRDINSSELISHFEYVTLEFPTGECKNNENLQVTDQFIYYLGNQYDRKSGKYLRKMGKAGRGPGEYILARKVYTDYATGEYYVHANWISSILIYDSGNHFVKSVQLPIEENMSMYYLGNRRFFIGREGVMIDKQIDYMIADLNQEKILYSKVNEEFSKKRERRSHDIGIGNVLFWEYNGDFYYYDPIPDEICTLDTVTWTGRLRFPVFRGKYRPSESVMLDSKQYKRQEGLYFQITSIRESGDYIFFNGNMGAERFLHIAFDKRNGETFLWNWKNDHGEYPMNRLTKILKKDQAYNLLNCARVQEYYEKLNRDELSECGQYEYDLFVGKDFVSDVFQIVRIENLKK